MSSGRKRTASALLRGMEASQASEAVPEAAEASVMPGNWSRQAMRGYQERAEIAMQQAAQANESIRQSIIDGVLPVQVNPDAIVDEVGTDRIASGPEDQQEMESFAALLENIRRRGLRTPLRVRPLDSEWRPDLAFPQDVSGQRFALQSGRRRLAACRELGIRPVCLISFPDRTAVELDDLEERYFENTVRRDLTAFERLYSVGLIASAITDSSQDGISEITGIPQSTISRGLSVLTFRDELGRRLNLSTASRNDIDRALREIRSGEQQGHVALEQQPGETRGSAAKLPFTQREMRSGNIKLRQRKDGIRVMTIESGELSDAKIAAIVKLLGRE